MFRSIRHKMLAAFALVLLIIALTSIWAIVNFGNLQGDIQDIMQSNYRSVVAAQHMMVALERQDSAQLSFLFSSDSNAAQNHREHEQEFVRWHTRARDNITEPEEPDMIDQIETLYGEYIFSFEELRQVQEYKGSSQARQYYYQVTFPLFESIKEACRGLLELNQEKMLQLQTQAEERASRAIFSTSLLSLSAILSGLFMALYISGQVSRPIGDLIFKMKRVAEGDYQQQISIQGDDEIAVLATEFNAMSEKLKRYERMNVNKIMMEKQKAEAIVESISDGVMVTDQNHHLILINKAAERFLDIREKESLGRHFLEVINREELFRMIQEVPLQRGVDMSKKFTDLTIESELSEAPRHFRVNMTPIRDQQGTDLGVVTLIQDITRLVEVNDLKSEFVSTVSHEFRTPLTSMTMAIGLLKDQTENQQTPDQQELLNALEEDTQRLTRLVTELLDLSRIESGKVQMNLEACLVDELVTYSMKPLLVQLKEKRITYTCQIADQIPMARADKAKIAWVLNNLVSNAMRYVPDDGTGVIEIKAKEAVNHIIIEVADNGKGIPEEYQKVIFDKFFQVHDQHEVGGGAGLGLAICKEIVKAHGGEIWVESGPDKGSVFYFTLRISSS
ncbi:sensor histidine kinase [Anoxynatronum buryatiense]|uniref:histidine kinase n=1 Tax=Anoxynatronum buryatiense TaxID=489973 RepID=A0AA45WVS4_9CLOT|nr:ATP-binding protein [Anoxynatronum buryatiense]SMP55174.1 PAS domain S-box-containing protein [Anoxynatronum buryatiense]